MEEQDNKPKVAVGCSGCLTLLFLLGGVVTGLLPVITDGKASWEETVPGIIGTNVCCFLSGILLLVSIIWLVKSNKSS